MPIWTSPLPFSRSTISVSFAMRISTWPKRENNAGIRSPKSPTYLSSSNSPLRNHQKPSGLVFMADTTCFSFTDVLPTMSMPAMARRRPSSTVYVMPMRSSSIFTESIRTCAK